MLNSAATSHFTRGAAAASQRQAYYHVDRRAISLVPPPPERSAHLVSLSTGVRMHHLLVTLEAQEASGCLKVVSRRSCSRSMLLLYKGRVLGCLYGRRGLPGYLTGRDGFLETLWQMVAPGNLMDSYQLPDKLVFATASLFHGSVHEFDTAAGPTDAYTTAVERLNDIHASGCILVEGVDSKLVCAVYMHQGATAGIVTGEGVPELKTHDMVSQHLDTIGNARVALNHLSEGAMEKAIAGSFSLTGIRC